MKGSIQMVKSAFPDAFVAEDPAEGEQGKSPSKERTKLIIWAVVLLGIGYFVSTKIN